MTVNILKAIIWDYDGTIADTSVKNYNVSRQIINKVTGGRADDYPALESPDTLYEANQRTTNWRDLYLKEFNFEGDQVDHVGSFWTEHQVKDQTEVLIFEGVLEILDKFNYLKHAIVSQNSRDSIIKFLHSKNIDNRFNSVYGYEQVDIKRQKPYPDGLIDCIFNALNIKEGTVVYVGDHVSDFLLVEKANKELIAGNHNIKVISAGIKHLKGIEKHWTTKPDYILSNLLQLEKIVAVINKQEIK
jgi:phosphoglycolate phosphatase-like HAD superfamily hydrolase